MKFFKYLILILISSFSINVYSADAKEWSSDGALTFYSTIEQAIKAKEDSLQKSYPGAKCASSYPSDAYVCKDKNGNFIAGDTLASRKAEPIKPMKCPDTGTPQVVFFDHGSPTPTKICAGSNGAYCSYSNSNPDVYNYTKRQMVILRSDSGLSTPTCTPSNSNDKCNASDPYGGCYTPPNDGCTRTSNGSIICPPDAPPPDIKKGCSGGASYCERPPQGCGSDYVSGNFNGKALCVKKGGDASKPNNNDGGSPPFSGTGGSGSGSGENGSGTGENGSGSGTGNGNNSNSSTSTSTSTSSSSNGSTTVNVTNNNSTTVNIDVSGVIKAVNQVTQTIKDTSYELNTSINQVTQAVNTSADKITNAVNTSGKNTVDAVNAGTEATKENGKKLDAVKKSVDEGNGVLKQIKDWLFADVDQNSFNAETPMRDLQQKDIESDKYKVSGQCPVSRTFSFKGHTFTLDLSNFCYVLEIMGIIVGIAACLHGVAILSENT